jgi:hypothetical protein
VAINRGSAVKVAARKNRRKSRKRKVLAIYRG